MNKWIILIAGIAGSGKTTLSNLLLQHLKMDHSVGLGWIREVVCKFFSKNEYPELFSYSFRPLDTDMTPYENLFKQSILLKPYIEVCIHRARREGTSLLLEGVNLIPGVIDPELVDYHFYLKSPDDINIYKNMIKGAPHKKRKINDADIANLKQIEVASIEKCREANIQIIDFASNEKRLEYIIHQIRGVKKTTEKSSL